MKYLSKILLISLGITAGNILIYLFLLQFQVVNNSGYIPEEIIPIGIILFFSPILFFIILLVLNFSKNKRLAAKIIAASVFIICFSLIWFTSADERSEFNEQQIYSSLKKYEWGPRVSTPEGFPIKILTDSRFAAHINKRTYRSRLDTEIFSEKWGLGNSYTFNGGSAPLPDFVNFTWYSYLEDKYYRLETKVDEKKIVNFFNEISVWDIGTDVGKFNHEKYRTIVAGFAPGGNVVLWVSGYDFTHEIGSYKAKEVNIKNLKNYDIVKEEDKKYVLQDSCTCNGNPQFRKIVNYTKPIPIEKWVTKYRKRYNWETIINNFGQKKTEVNINYFNGEAEINNENNVKTETYQNLAVPNYLNYTFYINTMKYNAFFDFDEKEIYNAFEEITKRNPTAKIDLLINIKENLQEANIQLKSENKIINFKNMIEVDIHKY